MITRTVLLYTIDHSHILDIGIYQNFVCIKIIKDLW